MISLGELYLFNVVFISVYTRRFLFIFFAASKGCNATLDAAETIFSNAASGPVELSRRCFRFVCSFESSMQIRIPSDLPWPLPLSVDPSQSYA